MAPLPKRSPPSDREYSIVDDVNGSGRRSSKRGINRRRRAIHVQFLTLTLGQDLASHVQFAFGVTPNIKSEVLIQDLVVMGF